MFWLKLRTAVDSVEAAPTETSALFDIPYFIWKMRELLQQGILQKQTDILRRKESSWPGIQSLTRKYRQEVIEKIYSRVLVFHPDTGF